MEWHMIKCILLITFCISMKYNHINFNNISLNYLYVYIYTLSNTTFMYYHIIDNVYILFYVQISSKQFVSFYSRSSELLVIKILPQIARFLCQHGAHLGPVGPGSAPCWQHEPYYQGIFIKQFPENIVLLPIYQTSHNGLPTTKGFSFREIKET